MRSTRRCEEGGHADLEDFQLTLNHLFMQVIEHLDCPGWSANLTDMLLHLQKQDDLKSPGHSDTGGPGPALPANQPARVLMIPPQHRQRTAPIVEELQRILTTFQG